MDFTYSDLVPDQSSIPVVQAFFSLPLTPFFNQEGRNADQRTRGFHGKDFTLQFKDNGPFVPLEDREVFCGTDAFRVFSSEDLDQNEPYPRTGSKTRDYVFDAAANEVRVETVTLGNPAIGNIWPNSPTTATQGILGNDPPDHIEITLTEPVDKDWLSGKLSDWMSQSDEFRDATGSGLGTYSYVGQGATRSESDGYLATVGGGDVVARAFVFSGTPFGMVGDEGDHWNGNFSAWIRQVRRKNEPIVHREASDNFGIDLNMRVGLSIYRQGYAELELSEPVSGWRDDFGTFNEGEELDGAPKEASYGYGLDSLLKYIGEAKDHDLTLISRTGHRYRVTIEAGYDDWGGEEPVWVTLATHTLTTDPQTLRVSHQFQDPGTWAQLRVTKIERFSKDEWRVVSDLEAGDWPAGQIGASPCDKPLLLAIIRRRSGQPWGFYEFTSPWTARYRKKTLRMHLSPGTVEQDTGDCGGDLSGNYDCVWSEEHDAVTGQLMPRQVSQFVASLNGTDWTPDDPPESPSVPGGRQVMDSPTLRRWEGEYVWTGRFLVGFDAPSSSGKILSESESKVGVTFTDGENRAVAVIMDPPAPGSSLFFEGFRLG